jgi:hypothetical protein
MLLLPLLNSTSYASDKNVVIWQNNMTNMSELRAFNGTASDASGYVELTCTTKSTGIVLREWGSLKVKAGSELRIDFNVVKLPPNDKNFQSIFVQIGGVDTFGKISVTDKKTRSLVYKFKEDAVIKYIYFRAHWGKGGIIRLTKAVITGPEPAEKTITVNIEPIEKINALKAAGEKKSIVLASNAEAVTPIIIAAEAGSNELQAAKTLKKYLDKITGANFKILLDSAPLTTNYISVGNTAKARNAGLSKLKIDKDGIAVKVIDNNIYLFGNGTNGIMNAVMAFLEEDSGCRWYSDKWDYIPKDRNLKVEVVDRISIPDFSMRFVFSATPLSSNEEWTRNNRVMKWNKFNHVDKWFCHTYAQICPMSEFKKHPELFAKLPNGQPFNTQLCPTHPEIVKRAKERVKAALKSNKDKNATYISISETDGSTGYCHCDRCSKVNRKYQTPLAAHLTLVNEVARSIKDEFPDVKVEFLVYSKDFRKPPVNMKIEPNVAMWFCTTNIDKNTLYRNNKKAVLDFNRWNKLVKTTNIWEYDCDYSNYFRVVPSLYSKCENLKFWKRKNVNGVMFLEVYGTRGGDQQALRAWVLSKILWNTKLDSDKLALDFCQGVFGKAAPEMYQYYQLVKKAGVAGKSVEKYYGKAKFIAEANNIFARAFAKADSDKNKELRKRIENHYIPVAFMEIDSIYHKYPGNKNNFPIKRYDWLLEQIKQITVREEMKGYSELRSMSGRIAELELLKNAAKGGVISIYAINGTLYEYPVRKDPLAANGKAPRLPCNENWLVQWSLPSNLCLPGKKYQLRAQLRPINNSSADIVASAGVHFKVTKQRPQVISNQKSFVVQIGGKKLSNKEYRWINIGKPFVPEKDCYCWFAAAAGSEIGGLFVDKLELVPVK